MKVTKGILFNTADYRQLHLSISPLNWLDAERIYKEFQSEKHAELGQPFVNPYILTDSATQALELALLSLALLRDDEIWIVTTTGNRYISGCVTRTIEQFCSWNRNYSTKTKAILVNHEFGFCYEQLSELKKYGLPIIEDAAYSMFSTNTENTAGSVGDYVLYSLAKLFPVAAGGVLVANHGKSLPQSPLSEEMKALFQVVLADGLAQKEQIVSERKAVYTKLQQALAAYGFEARFNLRKGDVPGAFLFKAHGKNLQGLKEFLLANGIECSVFYGEEAFYIPCHQAMNDFQILYLVTLITSFLK